MTGVQTCALPISPPPDRQTLNPKHPPPPPPDRQTLLHAAPCPPQFKAGVEWGPLDPNGDGKVVGPLKPPPVRSKTGMGTGTGMMSPSPGRTPKVSDMGQRPGGGATGSMGKGSVFAFSPEKGGQAAGGGGGASPPPGSWPGSAAGSVSGKGLGSSGGMPGQAQAPKGG